MILNNQNAFPLPEHVPLQGDLIDEAGALKNPPSGFHLRNPAGSGLLKTPCSPKLLIPIHNQIQGWMYRGSVFLARNQPPSKIRRRHTYYTRYAAELLMGFFSIVSTCCYHVLIQKCFSPLTRLGGHFFHLVTGNISGFVERGQVESNDQRFQP